MSMYSSIGIAAAQGAVLIVLAPLVRTAIKKVKARMQNRVGPPLMQGYYDLIKLFRKESVASEHSSFIFQLTPLVALGATITVAMLIPAIVSFSPFAPYSDIILIAYLLGLSVFFTVLSGLDAGSAFGGMGSAREMMIYALSEPAMILVIFTIAVINGTTQLVGIVGHAIAEPATVFAISNVFAFFAFFIVALAENARIPVDNPATHLELTMVHEAMILEYSGRQLAFIEWASAIKLTVFLALLVTIFFPFGIAPSAAGSVIAIAFLLFVAKMTVAIIALGLIESSIAKLRLFRVPDFIGIAVVLSAIALISSFFM